MRLQIVLSFVAKSLAIAAFIVVLVLNYFAARPTAGIIYQTTTANVSNKYYTPMTPAGFTFIIWALIYLWQAGIIAYLIASFFLKNINHYGHLYENLKFHSAWFYAKYTLVCLLNCVWIVVWDRSYTDASLLIACCVLLFAITAFLVGCLLISYRELVGAATKPDLAQFRRTDLIWSHRVIQQNGLSIYVAWTTIASHINLCACLIYNSGVHTATAGYVALGVLLAVILAYFFVDLLLWDECTRYVITPHLVFLWAAGGIYSAHGHLAHHVYLIEVLLGVAAVALLTKIIVLIVRIVRDNRSKQPVNFSHISYHF